MVTKQKDAPSERKLDDRRLTRGYFISSHPSPSYLSPFSSSFCLCILNSSFSQEASSDRRSATWQRMRMGLVEVSSFNLFVHKYVRISSKEIFPEQAILWFSFIVRFVISAIRARPIQLDACARVAAGKLSFPKSSFLLLPNAATFLI